MKSRMHRLPAIVMTVVMTCVVFNILSAKDDWDKKAAREKADYLYIESQGAYAMGDYGRSIMTLRRAFELDSTDTEIAAEWAYIRLLTDEDMDSVQVEQNYQRLRRRFIENPRNYVNGQIFATVADHFNRIDDLVMVWSALEKLFPNRPEPTTQLAEAYMKMYIIGDSTALEKALAAYDRIEAVKGRTVDCTIRKATAFMIMEDTAAVVRELDALYRSAPADAYTNYAIGYTYNMLEMTDSAFVYFDHACEADSTFGPAYMARAQIYLTRGDTAAYDRQLRNALLSPDIEEEQKEEILANYTIRFGADTVPNPELMQLYTDLQTRYPNNYLFYAMYGMYLADHKLYPEAQEQLASAMLVDSTDEDVVKQYMAVSLILDDTASVVSTAEYAMRQFPDNFSYPIVASTYLRSLGQTERALAMIDSVHVNEVVNPKAVSSLLGFKADTYAAIGDTVKALSLYDEAIELYPANSGALNNAAYFITLTNGDLDKAARYSERSLKDDELNPTYLDTYAWVLFNKKDYTMARQYIDMALRAFIRPDEQETEGASVDIYGDDASADVFDHAGDIYFMTGERDKALAFWERALKLDPENALIKKKVKHKTIFFK